MDINDISKELYEYLRDIVELSPDNIRTVKTALSMIKTIAPSDIPLILNRINELIDVSQDLSWIIVMITRRQNEIKKDIKLKKDPRYVMLVRQGRPSTAAIEAEIRFSDKTLYDLDENIETISNILEYLNKLQDSIDKYIWLLRDKMKS